MSTMQYQSALFVKKSWRKLFRSTDSNGQQYACNSKVVFLNKSHNNLFVTLKSKVTLNCHMPA